MGRERAGQSWPEGPAIGVAAGYAVFGGSGRVKGGVGGMIWPLVLCRGLLPWTFCLPSIYCEKVLWAIHPKDSGYIQEGPGEKL